MVKALNIMAEEQHEENNRSAHRDDDVKADYPCGVPSTAPLITRPNTKVMHSIPPDRAN